MLNPLFICGNFEDNNVMHYLMLEYNNVEPFQWLQDISTCVFWLIFVNGLFPPVSLGRFLFHFNRMQI